MAKYNRFILTGMLAFLFAFIPNISVFSQDNDTAKYYISGGFGLGSFGFPFTFHQSSGDVNYKNGLTGGYILSFDYTLPTEFPLSVGIEVEHLQGEAESNIDTATFSPQITINAIMVRAAWHPDLLHNDKFDTYLLVKLGYAFGSLNDTYSEGQGIRTEITVSQEPSGLGVGLDIGLRYFFGKHWGIFTEIGWEGFFTKFNAKARWKNGSYSPANTWEGFLTPQKYFALGATYKW